MKTNDDIMGMTNAAKSILVDAGIISQDKKDEVMSDAEAMRQKAEQHEKDAISDDD